MMPKMLGQRKGSKSYSSGLLNPRLDISSGSYATHLDSFNLSTRDVKLKWCLHNICFKLISTWELLYGNSSS